jgi:hypothetical protein
MRRRSSLSRDDHHCATSADCRSSVASGASATRTRSDLNRLAEIAQDHDLLEGDAVGVINGGEAQAALIENGPHTYIMTRASRGRGFLRLQAIGFSGEFLFW